MTRRSVVRVVHVLTDHVDFDQLLGHLHDAGLVYLHKAERLSLFGETSTKYVFDLLPQLVGPASSRAWAETVAARLQEKNWNAVVAPEWTEVKP